jgi:hypothetical protein
MVVPKGNPDELRKQARYLHSIACLIRDPQKHDELIAKADALLERALAQQKLTASDTG